MASLAIISGGGSLPRLVAEGSQKLGRDFFIIALKGYADAEWVASYPHKWINVSRIGHMIREMRKQKIDTLVFAGHLKRPAIGNILQLLPDVEGFKLFWKLRGRALGDDALLREVAAFFEKQGFKVIGADQLVPDSLMPQGILSSLQPNDDDWKDIQYAAKVLSVWAQLDQGQAAVVQNGIILGVEAAEGTDELIKRCGAYKRGGRGPILVKIKKPQQDTRLDLPTVGPETVRQAANAGFSGIAVQAANALFLHPVVAIAEADDKKLFLTGFEPKSS